MSASRQRPLLGGATITLSIPSGRLRWVRCLHLLPDDTPDVVDIRAQREEAKSRPAWREPWELSRWSARYRDALNREAKTKTKTLAGPLVPFAPSSKRWNQLPKEIP